MKKERLSILFNRYVRQTSTPEEEQELMQLLLDPELKEQQAILVEEAMENMPQLAAMSDLQADTIFRGILEQAGQTKTPVRRLLSRTAGWAAAAVLLAVLGAGWLFGWFTSKTPETTAKQPAAFHDISPGTNTATLTLADGSHILLDSASTGQLAAEQGLAQIIKTADGRIEYKNTGAALNGTATVVYNTMSTPRGGQYQLLLPDGTNVWLNAASSITYPVRFSATERKVTIRGEAYFEVSPGRQQPFIVSVASTDGEESRVEVLGTNFNIHAYDNEQAQHTTLLQGALSVSRGMAKVLLQPGQQAVIQSADASPTSIPVHQADTDKVMAWKNGLFNFQDADLPAVMRQLERWYNIDVVFEGTVPRRRFQGELPRSLYLSQVLNILKDMQIPFRVEGRKLIIAQ